MKLFSKKQEAENPVEGKEVQAPAVENGITPATTDEDVMEYIRKRNPKKKSKVIRRIIIAAVLVIGIATVVILQARAAAAPLKVATVSADNEDIEQIISTSGTVETENEKTYYANVDGQVQTLNIEQGSTVSAGQILLTYNTDDLELAHEKSELDKSVTKMKLQIEMEKGAQNEVDFATSTAEVGSLDAQIADLEARIEQVHCMITSNQKWMENEGAELEDDITDLKSKKSSVSKNKAKDKLDDKIDEKREEINKHSNKDLEEYLRQGEDQLSKLKEKRGDSKSDQKTAENGILTPTEKGEIGQEAKLAEVTAKEAGINLERAKLGVSSDFAGIVTDVKAKEGCGTTGGTELFTIADTENVKVVMQVTKFDLEYLQPGQKADVTIAGHQYTGSITKIDKVAVKNDSGASVINADIHIDNPDEYIYLGVEAKVLIHIAKVSQALVVPVEVVNTDETGYYCYVINNGIVERRDLKLGISSETKAEVISGLNKGDQVVADSTIEVMEGMEAQPDSDQLDSTMSEDSVSADEVSGNTVSSGKMGD